MSAENLGGGRGVSASKHGCNGADGSTPPRVGPAAATRLSWLNRFPSDRELLADYEAAKAERPFAERIRLALPAERFAVFQGTCVGCFAESDTALCPRCRRWAD